uniref:uncharacterized protein LOC104265969 isoform X2 n=1 Tax=Ciona intestinalis TaxID=7719 RepID=UPI00089DB038|nr:uncharacterized protein LOC104265969 isoform X2 [Ciona intestinalis]XP_026691365.1 uncharacterized protein LOC104265969 isoform X2 [Ciona intestinalis]|eukprot:XP_018668339.1 uncharacterized protein LOC104265969 isoform X2 [Ciona intestinalis]
MLSNGVKSKSRGNPSSRLRANSRLWTKNRKSSIAGSKDVMQTRKHQSKLPTIEDEGYIPSTTEDKRIYYVTTSSVVGQSKDHDSKYEEFARQPRLPKVKKNKRKSRNENEKSDENSSEAVETNTTNGWRRQSNGFSTNGNSIVGSHQTRSDRLVGQVANNKRKRRERKSVSSYISDHTLPDKVTVEEDITLHINKLRVDNSDTVVDKNVAAHSEQEKTYPLPLFGKSIEEDKSITEKPKRNAELVKKSVVKSILKKNSVAKVPCKVSSDHKTTIKPNVLTLDNKEQISTEALNKRYRPHNTFRIGFKSKSKLHSSQQRPKTEESTNKRVTEVVAQNRRAASSISYRRVLRPAQQTLLLKNDKQAARYQQLISVYLDERWHKARKERFYTMLEDFQIKKKAEWQAKHKNKTKEIQNSIKRQQEQLNYVRGKHSAAKERRLNTQHVKWKFVKEVNQSDKYGLPTKTPVEHKVKEPNTNSGQGLSRQELRRKNEKRYEFIFEIGYRKPLSLTRPAKKSVA